MAGHVPGIIVLALGAGALGGADALHVLLAFAGQSPLVDLAICVLVIGMAAAQLLGTVLLARCVRKGRAHVGAGGGAAPGAAAATDCLAKVTLVVSVGVAFVVAACLAAVSGGLSSVRLLFDFAGKSPVTAALAVGSLACVMPLLREAGNAVGGAPAAARATGRFALTTQATCFVGLPLAAICLLLAVPFVAPGSLDGLRRFPGATNSFVGVGAATVAGAVLLARFYRGAPNAAGAGGVAAPAPATGFAEMKQVTSLGVVCFALACLIVVTPYAYAPPRRDSDCSV